MHSSGHIPYQKALSSIYALDKFGSRPGLDRIRLLLRALGDPQKGLRCVLVGGSNGKGSTACMMGEILRAQGLNVGTYFSPQVREFSERIRVNGRNAAKGEIADAFLRVQSACRASGIGATFFEAVTAMALTVFRKRGVDIAVLEVGLGGRLDAVNAVEPELSAIASISLEHTDVLGSTVGEIAHEKCGISRRGRKLVCGVLGEEARMAVQAECARTGARLVLVEDEMRLSGAREEGLNCLFFAKYEGEGYDIRLAAPGRFQVSNACVAIAACKGLGAGRKAIEAGLARARPEFRLQKVADCPLTIADCCHNPEAAFALASEAERLPLGRKVLLFSAMKDKDYRQVLRVLRAHFDAVVLCQVPLGRAAQLAELAMAARKDGMEALVARSQKSADAKLKKTEGTVAFMVKNPAKAFAFARGLAGKKGTVVAAGSIYLLAALFGRDKRRIAQ